MRIGALNAVSKMSREITISGVLVAQKNHIGNMSAASAKDALKETQDGRRVMQIRACVKSHFTNSCC